MTTLANMNMPNIEVGAVNTPKTHTTMRSIISTKIRIMGRTTNSAMARARLRGVCIHAQSMMDK